MDTERAVVVVEWVEEEERASDALGNGLVAEAPMAHRDAQVQVCVGTVRIEPNGLRGRERESVRVMFEESCSSVMFECHVRVIAPVSQHRHRAAPGMPPPHRDEHDASRPHVHT